MSIKSRKVALASAIFSMAVLASCGGGGGGGTTSTSTPTPPSTPPGPTTVAKVLAQTWTGYYAGNNNQVRVCDLKSDGTINCGNDLNPSADTTFSYQYEFSNGNVLLTDSSNNKAYYFDATAGTLNKLTNGKDVAGNAVSAQLTLAVAPKDQNPNFIIYTIGGSDVVITKSGNYVQKTSTGGDISEFYMGDNSNFVVVTDNTNFKTYRIDASGNVTEIKDNGSSILFTTLLAKYGDNILVQASNNAVYLLKDDGTLVKIDGTFSGAVSDAQMVKAGNDFYIAVRNGTNLYYYKNSTRSSNSPVTLSAGSIIEYALDGNGNLYYYDNSSPNLVRAITTGLIASSNGQAVPSFGGLIGTSAGVIAKGKDSNGNDASYLLSISGNNITSTISVNPDLFNAVDTCVTAKSPTNLGEVNGETTSQIMCVDSNTANFSWITYNNGSYNGKQLAPITGFGSYTDVEFYGNKAVVYGSTNKTEICSVGSTASICTPGMTVQGVVKKYNNILAMFASYTLSIGDLLAGTSNTIFTDLSNSTLSPGNISADVSMVAVVKAIPGSPCATNTIYYPVGNQIILYNNGTKTTFTSNNLCIYGNLLKLYK